MRLLLVQKFGGTSVSTPERRQQVVEKIARAKKDGYDPVVVISALGRKGEPYATDTLLDLAKQECPAIHKRELDMIMSCGEIVAGVIVVAALKQSGFDAVLLSGQQAGIITTPRHGDAQIIEIQPGNILRHVNEGKIVVIAGFQGISRDGEITTLGRGGSDTTASAIAAALVSNSVDIYTDVNGVMTADPRLVPSARPLKSVCYDDMCCLAINGAKVVHPRAVEVAMRHNIPLKVKCTFTDEKGTVVSHAAEATVERLRDKRPAGIAHQTDYAFLHLVSQQGQADPARLLRLVEQSGLSIDGCHIGPRETTLIGPGQALENAGDLAESVGLTPEKHIRECAKITLVGHSSEKAQETANLFIEGLQDSGTELIYMLTGPFWLSGIIPQAQLNEAVQAIHARLFET